MAEQAPPASRSPAKLRGLIRTRLTAGLVLILPLWIAVLLASFVFRLMRDASLWVIEGFLLSQWGAGLLERWGVNAAALRTQGLDALPTAIQWSLAIVAVILTVALVYACGLVTTNFLGRRVVGLVEAVVERVPLIKTVYRASKQVLESVAGGATQPFQRVALIPFPTRETTTIGFITKVTPDPRGGADLCAVFVPTTPNPTTGFVFVVRRTEVVELDWTVEEAIRVIMSGGVLLPDLTAANLRQPGSQLADRGPAAPAAHDSDS